MFFTVSYGAATVIGFIINMFFVLVTAPLDILWAIALTLDVEFFSLFFS